MCQINLIVKSNLHFVYLSLKNQLEVSLSNSESDRQQLSAILERKELELSNAYGEYGHTASDPSLSYTQLIRLSVLPTLR